MVLDYIMSFSVASLSVCTTSSSQMSSPPHLCTEEPKKERRRENRRPPFPVLVFSIKPPQLSMKFNTFFYPGKLTPLNTVQDYFDEIRRTISSVESESLPCSHFMFLKDTDEGESGTEYLKVNALLKAI